MRTKLDLPCSNGNNFTMDVEAIIADLQLHVILGYHTLWLYKLDHKQPFKFWTRKDLLLFEIEMEHRTGRSEVGRTRSFAIH
jgi:hypothetical protein